LIGQVLRGDLMEQAMLMNIAGEHWRGYYRPETGIIQVRLQRNSREQ